MSVVQELKDLQSEISKLKYKIQELELAFQKASEFAYRFHISTHDWIEQCPENLFQLADEWQVATYGDNAEDLESLCEKMEINVPIIKPYARG